jgi:hypothetical protein
LSTQQSVGSNFEWVPVRLDHKGPLHRRRVLAKHPAIWEALYSEHLVIAQRTDEHGVSSGAATAEANVPLSFAPGEKYQFDWSHEVVLINGTMVTVKVASSGCVLAECCSCAPIRARPRRWCSVPTTASSFFKGTCTRGIYDSLGTPPPQDNLLVSAVLDARSYPACC